MKNADLPAMPQDYTLFCEGIGLCPTTGTGLTKREHFAGLAMQGFISAGHNWMPKGIDLACYAVAYADALLAELDKD